MIVACDDTKSTAVRSGVQRTSAAFPCAICRKPKDCLLSSNGAIWCCYTNSVGCIESKIDKNGRTYYLHPGPNYEEREQRGKKQSGGGKRRSPAAQATTPQQHQTATAEVTQHVDPDLSHRAYEITLQSPLMRLTDEHRAALHRRGLTDEQIDAGQYRSIRHGVIVVPDVPAGEWESVPGFFYANKQRALKLKTTWSIKSSDNGILVPCRNRAGKIIKSIIRRDDASDGRGKYICITSSPPSRPDAPSPGNPIHFPLGTPTQADAVWLTEGVLKADLVSALSGWPCLGLSGVWGWRDAIPALQAMQARTAIVAYDADCQSNRDVASALRAAVNGLRAAGIEVRLATWPTSCGKGLDDCLAAGHRDQIEIVETTADVDALVSEILTAAGVPPEQQAAQTAEANLLWEAPDDPHALATSFLAKRYCHPGSTSSRLRYWKGAFYAWTATRGCDKTISESEIVASLTTHIKQELDRDYKKSAPKDDHVRKVTRSLVSDTLNVVRSLSIISGDLQPPCWLITPEQFTHSPQQLLVTPTALLHVPSIEAGSQYEHPATPDFFALAATSWSYDPAAPEPVEWLKFLTDVWEDDHSTIALVQEWFGLNLVPDTSFQKLVILCGPRRSGKGVLCRTLTALVGEGNVAAPTLTSLSERFALAPLLGKLAAVVSDARLSNKADQAAITELILRIVGEDAVQIDRKYLESLIAQLTVRFTIACNEIPKLQDQANALSGRTLLLPMTRSFFGQEDSGLTDRLRKELPSIAKWAISGLQRLYRCGRFEQPESGKQVLQEMADLQSPITSFLRNCCYVDLQDEDLRIDKKDLYERYRSYCEAEGLPPRSLPIFCRDLRTVLPGLRDIQTNAFGVRTRKFIGIRIGVDDQPQEF